MTDRGFGEERDTRQEWRQIAQVQVVTGVHDESPCPGQFGSFGAKHALPNAARVTARIDLNAIAAGFYRSIQQSGIGIDEKDDAGFRASSSKRSLARPKP
jgi:hypothetical protein